MADCPQVNSIGRTVAWEFFELVCGDADPTSLSYLPLGSTNNKTWNLTSQSTDNTTDQTFGVTSNLVTYISLESTASGYATGEDGTLSNQARLYKYYVNEIQAGRQPTMWVRVTFSDITVYAYVNITAYNRAAASGDTVTFELSVQSTSTGTVQPAIVVEDTPQP